MTVVKCWHKNSVWWHYSIRWLLLHDAAEKAETQFVEPNKLPSNGPHNHRVFSSVKFLGRFLHSTTGFFNISTISARHMLVWTFNFSVITRLPESGPPHPPCLHLFEFGKPPPANVQNFISTSTHLL